MTRQKSDDDSKFRLKLILGINYSFYLEASR